MMNKYINKNFIKIFYFIKIKFLYIFQERLKFFSCFELNFLIILTMEKDYYENQDNNE